jgi:hypothetical protein
MKTKLVQSRASGYWIIQYTDAEGKRRKHSTGKKDKKEAFQYLLLHHDELTMPQLASPSVHRNGSTTLAEFAKEINEYYTGRGQKAGDKRFCFRKLIEFLGGDTAIKNITMLDMEKFFATRESSGHRGISTKDCMHPSTKRSIGSTSTRIRCPRSTSPIRQRSSLPSSSTSTSRG